MTGADIDYRRNSSLDLEKSLKDYFDYLTFRKNKRNSEYRHHPISWDDGLLSKNESSPCFDQQRDEQLNTADLISSSQVDSLHDALEKCSCKECGDICTELENVFTGGGVKHLQDASTQTIKSGFPNFVKHQKPFVLYAIGDSKSAFSGVRRTFNVKSEGDVYPSAIRASACRQKLMGNAQHETKATQCGEIGKAYRKSTTDLVSHAIPSSTNVWSSEYTRKYPVYPTSVYVRSASTAASRCRPFSCGSRRNRATPLTSYEPVLLSSRGSSSRSVKHERDTYCNVSSCIKLDPRYLPKALNAH